MGRRFVVIGTTGSGKTTLSRKLAGRLGVPHVELDALHWGPGWEEPGVEVFRGRVREAVSGDAWVVDGNYSEVRDLVWGRADTVVWLDFPLRVIMRRLVPRSLKRVALRERLWGTNTETLTSLLGRDSIVLFALKSHGRQRRNYPGLLRGIEGAEVVHLTSQEQVDGWLSLVKA